MRIVAGKHRSRIIKETNLESTRETQDKVRQAIFNMCGQYLDQKVVLDLFCGSGAMGLEAISRGAKKCYFNDINKNALDVTISNTKLLNEEDKAVFFNLDYIDALKKIDEKLDLIFLDPPYKMINVNEILDLISLNNRLSEDSLLIFEMAKETNFPQETNAFYVLKEKKYGIKKVIIYGVKK